MDVQQEVCLMHSGDKVGSSAVGHLIVRTRNHVQVNPFEPGLAVVENMRGMARHFGTPESRYQELYRLGEVAAPESTPRGSRRIKIQLDLSAS